MRFKKYSRVNLRWRGMIPSLCGSLLLFASAQSHSADHFVPANVSTVNCGTYGGGVKPGDTLTVAAGKRGPLSLRSCRGTASQAITIRNDPAARSPVVMSRATAGSGGFVFQCHNCIHVIIDGTQRWSGFPSGGYCGAPDGRDGCGIKVTSEVFNDSPSAYLKISGLSTNVTVRGVEVDGRMADLKTAGVGIDLNDHSITVADHPNFWREGFLFEGNFVHNVHGEGMYLGPNWREPDLRAPLRNITIRRNLVEDTGRESIQLKSAIGGTNKNQHKDVRRSGLRKEGTQHGAGISVVEGGAGLSIYSNWVEDAGLQGIQQYNRNVPLELGIFKSDIFNNVVYRAGRFSGTEGNGHGITVGSSSTGTPITSIVHFNTIVEASGSGINFSSRVVEGIARDNIVLASGRTALSMSGNRETNNLTGTVAEARFISPQKLNFQLTADSPARDSGSTSGGPANDFLDNKRPQGDKPDLGAFEYMSDVARPRSPAAINVE